MYTLSELADQTNMTPRMLRHRIAVGLLPTIQRRHRTFTARDAEAIRIIRRIEIDFNASPDEIAFALSLFRNPRLSQLIERLRGLTQNAEPLAALDFEKEKALNLLSSSSTGIAKQHNRNTTSNRKN